MGLVSIASEHRWFGEGWGGKGDLIVPGNVRTVLTKF